MIDIKTGKEMTRRDFIGGGLAAASSVALFGSANATVRHGLGARLAVNFAGGGGGGVSAKSYVQDGLVAMWDGIENGGFGVHNEGGGPWVDCIGSRVSTNSAQVSYDGIGYLTNGGTIQLNASDVSTSTRTIEFVIRWISGGSNDPIFRDLTSAYNDFSYYVSSGQSYVAGMCRSACWKAEGDDRYKVYSSSITTDINAYLKYSPVYKNGVYVITASPSITTFRFNYQARFYCELYAFRIYDRILSEDEIAANFCVDSPRFGIT